MAIRDFGESLLADVRERKDSQARDARKYAKKQQRKELLISGGAWLGSQLWDIGNSALAQKTQNFLGQSNLYDNKIKVNKAETLITEAQNYQALAKEKGISIDDLMLNNIANKKANQAALEHPNTVFAEDLADYTSAMMRNTDVKDEANRHADYWKDILSRADNFAAGKDNQTLSDIASRAGPRSIVGSAWNKLTGSQPSVDVFNSNMDQMQQVIEATAISGLSYDKKKQVAVTAVAQGATQALGKMFAGIRFSPEELEDLEASIRRGDKIDKDVEYMSTTMGILEIKEQTVTPQNNTGTVTTTTNSLIHKPGVALTVEEGIKLTGGLQEILDNVARNTHEDGIAWSNFSYMLNEITKGKAVPTLEQYWKVSQLSVQFERYLSGPAGKGSMRRPENSEILKVREDAFLKVGSGVLIELASLEGMNDEASNTRRAELYIDLGNIQKTVHAFSKPSQLTYPTREENISAVMEANPTWSKAKATKYFDQL